MSTTGRTRTGTGTEMLRALGLALAASVVWAAPSAGAAECEPATFDGAGFTFCTVDLEQEELRLFLRDADGVVFGGFNSLDRALRSRGKALGVAMNAGMYHEDRSPVGLYIEDGREERRVITSEGPGNFGLLPNGLLCIDENRAAVIESRQFADARPDCRHATQSGPMLVIEGTLHPRFLPDSDSLKIRNGVGIRDGGRTAVLAISDQPVNFHHFARFFRDAMGTPSALFLDGSISRLHAPGIGRSDPGLPLGPILGTVEPAE